MEDPRQESEEIEEQERVARFMRANPDFFAHRADLLSAMNIPHARAQGTSSLIERQVQVLRDKHRHERERLEALVKTARDNERVGNRLHEIALELMIATQLDTVFDSIPPLVRELFRVDSAVIRVEHEQLAGTRKEWVHPNDPAYIELRARVAHGRSAADNGLPVSIKESLFGGDAPRMHSAMLLPVGGKRPIGVLVLASVEKNRFEPDQGTFYLDRLGELMGAVLRRLFS
ncbi:MAG: hypothetical protein MAG794_00345 [Gammaproteobacteria bacterium]|nr:hypothetical protein [Gammaproteobacteria bacterium]